MGFFKFLREQLVVFGLVGGGILTAWGYASDAYGLYKLGLPAVLWQVTGVAVVVSSLILFVHRNKIAPVVALEQPEPVALPPGADPKIRAISALRQARTSAQIAVSLNNEKGSERAFHEVQAALVSAHRQFEIPIPKITGEASYLDLLGLYVSYIDCFYPLLREGHYDVAKAAASKFRYAGRPVFD